MNLKEKLKKFYFSLRLYGFHRAYSKALSFYSIRFRAVVFFKRREKDVLLSGCGQFGASTASFFIAKQHGNRFLGCYDLDESRSQCTKIQYGYNYATESFDELIKLSGARYLFIASNHASHVPQAVAGLKQGLIVHVEKPLAVSWEQLALLWQMNSDYPGKLFVGYNRPFSKFVKEVRERLAFSKSPYTIQNFIAGHKLEADHWYYSSGEGTRVCGNVSHWIDLAVHLLSSRSMPPLFEVKVQFSNAEERDTNFVITLTSDYGDLICVTFTARMDPIDGVQEFIVVQTDRLMAKIDDFRAMTLWEDGKLTKRRSLRKDVGHKYSVSQMFTNNAPNRDVQEVFLSSMLTLHISDMVQANIETSIFDCRKSFERLAGKSGNYIRK